MATTLCLWHHTVMYIGSCAEQTGPDLGAHMICDTV